MVQALRTMDDRLKTALLEELLERKEESECLEFKHNNVDPKKMGENISAIANACALQRVPVGHIVWGVGDKTFVVEGTTFRPRVERVDQQELVAWLGLYVRPSIGLRFLEIDYGGKPVVILEIPAATNHPVAFKNIRYIRIGTTTKTLEDYPGKEARLWEVLKEEPFEGKVAFERISADEVISLLDYPAYFELMEIALPDGRDQILERLCSERFVINRGTGRYDVLNLAGLLFARRLDDWPTLRRKAVRVVQYDGVQRTKTLREQEGRRGYAAGFSGILTFIDNLLPQTEEIRQGIRATQTEYPQLAIRELAGR
jgi:predicted HTH transcriptional regulator